MSEEGILNGRPVDERDIWSAASQMVKLFGNNAELMAAQRADRALEAGDTFNERLWKRVTLAVRNLQRCHPSGEEQLN